MSHFIENEEYKPVKKNGLSFSLVFSAIAILIILFMAYLTITTSNDNPSTEKDTISMELKNQKNGEIVDTENLKPVDLNNKTNINSNIVDTNNPGNNVIKEDNRSFFQDFIINLFGLEKNQSQKSNLAFYQPRKSKDGFKDSFYDLTLSDIKDINGNIVGKITDIIVDKKTGEAIYIVFSNDASNKEGYEYVDFKRILSQEKDGDIQITLGQEDLATKKNMIYSPELLEKYISLKYLRQGDVTDAFDETVGEIMAIIYENTKIESIYFLLDKRIARGKDRIQNISFDKANIQLKKDGMDLKLSKDQTEYLADKLFDKKAKPQ